MGSQHPFARYQERGLSEPIQIEAPRMTFWCLTIGAALFGLAGAFLLVMGSGTFLRLVGAVSLVFFGGGAALVFPPFLKSGAAIVFDREGFFTRRYQVKIRWQDVKAVGVLSAGGGESLCVAVDNYRKYRANVPWSSTWLRFIYRALPGQVGALALIAATDAGDDPDGWKMWSKARGFDFIWSGFELGGMEPYEARDLIEAESARARGL